MTRGFLATDNPMRGDAILGAFFIFRTTTRTERTCVNVNTTDATTVLRHCYCPLRIHTPYMCVEEHLEVGLHTYILSHLITASGTNSRRNCGVLGSLRVLFTIKGL